MKKWLCLGNKTNAKCVYAHLSIDEEIRPIIAENSLTRSYIKKAKAW
jgi:hypothetical protein